MKTILENIAQSLNLETHYAEESYTNLFEFDEESSQKKFLLEPIIETAQISDNGFTSVFRQTGKFFIASHSSLDEYYDKNQIGEVAKGKYELYLKPNSILAKLILKQLECRNDLLNISWVQKEVINLFDMGADGILVDFVFDKTEQR